MCTVRTKTHLLSQSVFILEIIEVRAVLNTQLSLLGQFSRWPTLLHSFRKLPSLERADARKRSGTNQTVPESLRAFPLHLWPLAALWDTFNFVTRRVFISVCSVNSHQHLPSSQAVNRDVCLLQGCMVGASVPDNSLTALLLNCGHSSDWGAAGGSLVWNPNRSPGAHEKGCSTENQWWRTKPSSSCLADSYWQPNKCIISLTKQM